MARLLRNAVMSRLLISTSVTLAFLASAVNAAPPAVPPPPAEFDAVIRFSLEGGRLERITDYNGLVAALGRLGFRRDPEPPVEETEPLDPRFDRFKGVLPSARVPDVLNLRPVLSVLLLPHGVALPEDKMQAVAVRLELTERFRGEQQRLLYQQTRKALEAVGFEEAVGHDHRGFTVLSGLLPAGQVGVLATDLRKLPGAEKLPQPFARLDVLRVAEVFPEMKPERRQAVSVPRGMEKLSPDLRALVQSEDKGLVRRFEIILAQPPAPEDRLWQGWILDAGLVVEGRLGSLITVSGPPSVALEVAKRPDVTGVRLPRLGRSELPRNFVIDPSQARPVVAAGRVVLDRLANGGAGMRVAVVDADFRGWAAEVGKSLPAGTRFLDLTCERNRDLNPDPLGPPSNEPGTGTQAALALTKLAPRAELTLVRVDAEAPYMLQAVARTIAGEGYRSLSLESREIELETNRVLLARRAEDLVQERQRVLNDFAAEEDPEREKLLLQLVTEQLLTERILGLPGRVDPERLMALVAALETGPEVRKLPGGKLSKPGMRRLLYRVRQRFYDRALAEHLTRTDRFNAYLRDTAALRGICVVLSGPVWNEGFPLNATSPLSRWFDDRPFRAALWFQATAATRGQAWTGLFRDTDGNGVMEFTPATTPLPAGSWTNELNFMGWLQPGQEKIGPLPEKARLRLSLQWREVLDPEYARVGEDPYLEARADLRIVVLYQPDPDGKKLPADSLEVVARSVGPALRLEKTTNSAIYEQTVLVDVSRPGRYAVRIEGKVPDGVLPKGVPTIPAARRTFELTPRLFVETLAGPGRAVFESWSNSGSAGMPADALQVVPLR
jgi:hypothetical protein